MNLENRIAAFSELGRFLKQFAEYPHKKTGAVKFNDLFFDGFKHQIKLAGESNGWFTPENILFALGSWSDALMEDNLKNWLEKYQFNEREPRTVAIVMAGNIPMVGFHDLLSVLICGHKAIVKQSTNDKHLLPFLMKYLEYVEPGFKERIIFTDDRFKNYDAVIATGSDNTARYFEYYFKNKAAIIRRNRNSVAVLSGKETEAHLEALSEDVFRYFGLGCRNVSKIFVPEGYNFDDLFRAFYKWRGIIDDQKYANNYDYNKAVFLMSEYHILENGFFILKEDLSYVSPIASLFYEYYTSEAELKTRLRRDKDKIQCVVSEGFLSDEVRFGQTQKPGLSDYADGIDTVDFLLKI